MSPHRHDIVERGALGMAALLGLGFALSAGLSCGPHWRTAFAAGTLAMIAIAATIITLRDIGPRDPPGGRMT